MLVYVPIDLLKDPDNENKIHEIFEKVLSDDLVFEGAFTVSDALEEILTLGETEFVTFFELRYKLDNY